MLNRNQIRQPGTLRVVVMALALTTPLSIGASRCLAAPTAAPAAPVAHAPMTPPPNPLGLSKSQQDQWRAIQSKYNTRARAIEADKSASPTVISAKLAVLKIQGNAELEKILNAHQQVIFRQKRAEQDAMQARGQSAQQAAMRLQASLTPQQKKQLESVQAEIMPQQQKLAADKTLPRQQRIMRMEALQDSAIAKINAFLTPQQRPDFATIMAFQKQMQKMNAANMR